MIAQGIEYGLENLANPAPSVIYTGVDDRPTDADKFSSLGVGDQDIGRASDTAIEPYTETGIGLFHLLMDLPKYIDRTDGVEDEAATVVADINPIGS